MTHETELAELELAQKRLEVEKLRVEVDQARLAWWKRPGYLGGMAPIVLALVGLVTAWANGYFDTQRAQLATEISDLAKDRDALAAQVAKAQRAIDYGYLEAKLAAYDAAYAISHFEAFSQRAETLKAPLDSYLVNVPDISEISRLPGFSLNEVGDAVLENFKDQNELLHKQNKYFQELIDLLNQQQEIGAVSRDALAKVASRLEQLDASPWLKELQTDPMFSQNRQFFAPNGRIFDLDAWDWVAD